MPEKSDIFWMALAAVVVAFISWMAWSAVEPDPAVDTKQLIIDIPYRLQWRNSEDVLDDNTLKRDYIAWLVSKDIPYFKVDDLQVTTIDDVTREITINCTGDNQRSQNCISTDPDQRGGGAVGSVNYGDVVEPFTGTIKLSELIKADTHDCLAVWCPTGTDPLRCPINCYARASDGIPPPRCLRPPIIDDAITLGSFPSADAAGANTFRQAGYDGEYTLLARQWQNNRCVDAEGNAVQGITAAADCEPILMTTTTDPAVPEKNTPFEESPLWRDDFNVKIKCNTNYSSSNPQVKFGEDDQSTSRTYYLDAQCGEADWHYSINRTCNERCASFEENPDVDLSTRWSGEGKDILQDAVDYSSGPPMKKDFDDFNVKYKCADGWGPQSGNIPQGVYNVLCPTPGDDPVFPTQCERHCSRPDNARLLEGAGIDPESFESSDLNSPDPVLNFNDSLFDVTYTCLPGWNPPRIATDGPVAVASRLGDDEVPAVRMRATKCQEGGGLIGFEEVVPCVRDCIKPNNIDRYTIDEEQSTYAKGQFSLQGPNGEVQCAPQYGETKVAEDDTGVFGIRFHACNRDGDAFQIDGCEPLCKTPGSGDIYNITGADTSVANKDDFRVTASCKFPQAGAEAISGPRVYPCQEAGGDFQLTGCYPQCPGANHCSNGKIVLAYSADLMPQSADADIMTQIVNAMKAAGSQNFGTEDIAYYNKAITTNAHGQPHEIVVEYQIRCPEGEDCGIENLEQVEESTAGEAVISLVDWPWTTEEEAARVWIECEPNREELLDAYAEAGAEGGPATIRHLLFDACKMIHARDCTDRESQENANSALTGIQSTIDYQWASAAGLQADQKPTLCVLKRP